MATNKKRKKASPQPQIGGYKHFMKDLREALAMVPIVDNLSDFSNEEKRFMYGHNLEIRNPVAGNEYITSKELKFFSEKAKKYYREKSVNAGDKFYSIYQLQLVCVYAEVRATNLVKTSGNKMHPEAVKYRELSKKLIRIFFERFLIYYYSLFTKLSNPDQKYYGVKILPALNNESKVKIVFEISGFPAQKRMMKINGYNRTAFQLGKAIESETKPFHWISVDVLSLGNFYTGNKQKLDVFIQSHALSRLSERLDLLDREAINYVLWENTNTALQFGTYKGYLLLPFKVFEVKIGYLVANVIDEKLLFRTFLFITHNSTPEGDRLRQLTGLSKEDITYWHIDRLSTFVNLNEEQYPELIRLFSKAGLGGLRQLKDKEFNIDSMQAANLNGLTEYINRGKQERMIPDQNCIPF
jgi:hypothetical protein